MTTKPTKYPRWATVPSVDPVVGGDNVVEPPEQLKDDGWARKQKPPANYQNWLHNLTYLWLLYLEDAAESLPKNYRSGVILVNNSSDPINDIDFGVGKWRSSNDTVNLILTSTMVKQIDAPWAPGTNDGGFPSGLTLTQDTWYHCFLIGKPDGTTDAGFDSDITATNLLTDATGYTTYRRVGSIKTEATTTNIRQFIQYDDLFLWASPGLYDFQSSVTTAETITLVTPLGIKVNSFIHVELNGNIPGGAFAVDVYLSSLDVANVVPSNAAITISLFKDGISDQRVAADFYVVTNTASQIRGRTTAVTNVNYHVGTKGWKDFFDNL